MKNATFFLEEMSREKVIIWLIDRSTYILVCTFFNSNSYIFAWSLERQRLQHKYTDE